MFPPVLLSALVLGTGSDTKPAPVYPRLLNGSMERGTSVPTGWRLLVAPQGEVSLERDSRTRKDGIASLRLVGGGDAAATVGQAVRASGPQTVRLSGWMRLAGDARYRVGAQALDANKRPLATWVLKEGWGRTDWTLYEDELDLPEGTRTLLIAASLDGPGSLWLDGVRLGLEDAVAPVASVAPPPTEQDPVLPYPGRFHGDPEVWMDVHARQKEGVARSRPNVLFLGDSITEMWDETLWSRYFAPLRAANVGIRGDRTNQVLWRVMDGLVDTKPKLVVLAVGVNNLWNDRFGEKRIAEGVGQVIKEIRRRSPRTQVLVVGLFPTDRDPNSGFRYVVPDVNRHLRELADGRAVRYVDLGGIFLARDGSIPAALMPDGLHLSRAGYEKYAKALAPVVHQLLRGPEAKRGSGAKAPG